MDRIKNVIIKIVLSFDFTIVQIVLVQIDSLVTEIQNFGEYICSILYFHIYISTYQNNFGQYKTKYIR